MDIIKNKFVLLNLIGSITGTPASATGRIGREDEIGYLVRRLKDSRTSKDVKKDLKQKLIAIKSEIAKEKEEQETLKEDADSEKTESFTEWPHFDEFFMVSALHGDGLSKLQVTRMWCACSPPLPFPPSFILSLPFSSPSSLLPPFFPLPPPSFLPPSPSLPLPFPFLTLPSIFCPPFSLGLYYL